MAAAVASSASHSWLWPGASRLSTGLGPSVFLQNTKLQEEALAASCVHTASILGVQRAQTLLLPFQTKLNATKDR